MYGVELLDTVQCWSGYNCVYMEKKYSAVSHVFDQMTLIFLHKPVYYGVICLLYGVVCSDSMDMVVYPAIIILTKRLLLLTGNEQSHGL